MVSLIVHSSIILIVGLLLMIFPSFFSHIFIYRGPSPSRGVQVNPRVAKAWGPKVGNRIIFYFGLVMVILGSIILIYTLIVG